MIQSLNSEFATGDQYNIFLKSSIKCISCNQGPSGFSTYYHKEKRKIISKYGNYCSIGCAMYPREELKLSRSKTPPI